MSRGFSGAVLRGFGARDYTLTVVSKTEITPHFWRIRFSAPSLFEAVSWEPAAWLRFWFPDPAGSRREFQRAYTIAYADPPSGEFDIDVLMHQPPGPATLWFAQARPGDMIVSTFYGSRFRMPQPEPAGFLLVGDACATPAINSIISAISAHTSIELILEHANEEDLLIPLAAHPKLQLQRIPRTNATSLVEAIQPRHRSGWYAWGAGEAASMKLLHKALKDRHGFTKDTMHIQSYWLEPKMKPQEQE
ncbi:MAG: siderophore-interacting protein [Anaerolineales bacterium]|nr:siderophore-interacting protein [Anaerolineales bacterium]